MKIIDTSAISAISGYPGLANVNSESITGGDPSKMVGLDFLQQNILDMVDALCRAMIVDPTKPTVIATFPLPSPPIAGYAVPQYIYYQGEVFFVPGYYIFAIIGGGGGGAYIATLEPNPTDNGSSAPLTVMSDASVVSIHNQRTITVSWSSTGLGGNFPAPSTWLYPQTNFQCFFPTVRVVGTGIGVTDYHAGWSQNTRLAYYIIGNEVTIQGDATFTSITSGLIFYLPLGYRPLYDLYIPIYTSVASTFLYIGASDGRVVYEGPESTSGIAYINAKFTIL